MSLGIQGRATGSGIIQENGQHSSSMMNTINKLKEELATSRADTERATTQLNCLISLMKRAWTGDAVAVQHLSNIIGVSPPNPVMRNPENGTDIPDCKTRAVHNWERLVLRSLEREYAIIQAEIEEKQRCYIENRQLYMDEILANHEHEMSKLPINKRREEIDNRFLNTFSKSRPSSSKPGTHKSRRSKSAVVRRPHHHDKDYIVQENLTVGDLFVQPVGNQTEENTTSNVAFSGLYKLSTEDQKKRHSSADQTTYDNPERYKQPSLFDTEEVLGEEHYQRKNRPLSAVHQHEHDRFRSRPKSAVFLTEGRPLKFEATRPMSTKSRNQRNSKKEIPRNPPNLQEFIGIKNQNNLSFGDIINPSKENTAEPIKKPIKVRVKSGVRRPEFIDEFSNDLKNMDDLQTDFKERTLQLQKKLGISDSGMVCID